MPPTPLIRTIAGFIISPLAAGVLFSLWRAVSSESGFASYFALLLFVLVFAYLLTLILVLPCYLFLAWKKWLTLPNVLLMGFLIPSTIYFLLHYPNHTFYNWKINGEWLIKDGVLIEGAWRWIAYEALKVGFFGSIGALVFWMLVIRQKSDLHR